MAPLKDFGRKVLLVLDGYREHISLDVLECFDGHGNTAHVLPAYTSEMKQPCVFIFSPFKDALGDAMKTAFRSQAIEKGTCLPSEI